MSGLKWSLGSRINLILALDVSFLLLYNKDNKNEFETDSLFCYTIKITKTNLKHIHSKENQNDPGKKPENRQTP